MICPVCGTESPVNICEECSADIELHTRLISISAALYNKGLEQANAGDLSGAAESLSHAVQFDKENYTARNLLGLVYYAVGRIGDALLEWVISTSLAKEGNPANVYIDAFQADTRTVDKMNDSCRLYNQAIVYLKSKSEDMAIIRLKKAIEMNPTFVDAMNLLSFCYLMKRDSAHALSLAERALQIDVKNETALKYFNLISGKSKPDTKKTKTEARKESVTRFTPFDAKAANKPRNLHISDVICFVLGALAALAVCYYLVLPEMRAEDEAAVSAIEAEHQQVTNGFLSEIAVKENTIRDRDQEIEKLKSDIEELSKANEIHTRVQRVNTALNLFEQGMVEEALLLVNSIDTANLPVDTAELHASLRDKSYPILEKQYYDQGVASYNARNYEIATTAFLNSEKFTAKDSEMIDDTYYYMGRICELQSKPDDAKAYYQKIVDSYPKSNQLNNAKFRLRNL